MRIITPFILSSILLTSGFSAVKGAIRGVSWFGFETTAKQLTCVDESHPVESYLQHVYELGFNHIRLPFSIEFVREGNWEKMDHFFDIIKQYPINVTLDAHRVYSTHQAYDPCEGESLDEFIDHWTTILKRYEGHERLYGVDAFNEAQLIDTTIWNGMLHKIIETLEGRFPGRFVYFAGGVRWGGSLHDISLEDLPFRDRIYYTLHKYSFSSGQNWEQDWDYAFGQLVETGRVTIGEYGFRSDLPDQVEWAKQFTAYLKRRNIKDTFFWCLHLSDDTHAIYYSCQPEDIDYNKYDLIRSFWESTDKKMLRGRQ